MSSVSAYFELARWQNCLIAAAGVLVGAYFGAFPFSADSTWANTVAHASFHVAVACFVAICLTITANAWNDAADVAIDRLVHPTRPVAAGIIAPDRARTIALVAAAIAVLLAAVVSLWMAVATAGVALLMLAYSPWLKRIVLFGNVVAAALASLPFAYGAWASGWVYGVALSIWAFPLHLAREIAKDLDDAAGDAGHRETIPLAWGGFTARAVVIALLLLFMWPVAISVNQWNGLVLCMAPATLYVAGGGSLVLRRIPGAPTLLKVAMLLAMIGAVLLSTFGDPPVRY